MEEYRIKIVSQANSILALVTFFAIFFSLMILRTHFLPIPLGKQYSILIAIGSILLFYFIFQKLATAKTKWSINEKSINISWVTQFAFTKKSNIIIKWEEIEKYNKRTDPMYETIQIKLLSGESLDFYHSNGQFRDDFSELSNALSIHFKKQNSI